MVLQHWEAVFPKDIHIFCIKSNIQIDCWADIFQDGAENRSCSRPLRQTCHQNEPIHSVTTHGQANHNRAGNGISVACARCGSLNMMTSVTDYRFHAVHKLPDLINALLCHTTLNGVIHWGEWTGFISKCISNTDH